MARPATRILLVEDAAPVMVAMRLRAALVRGAAWAGVHDEQIASWGCDSMLQGQACQRLRMAGVELCARPAEALARVRGRAAGQPR